MAGGRQRRDVVLAQLLRSGSRYEGSDPCYVYSCMDYDFNSDVVYKIDPTTGTVTNFITNYIWGPYQMIFVP